MEVCCKPAGRVASTMIENILDQTIQNTAVLLRTRRWLYLHDGQKQNSWIEHLGLVGFTLHMISECGIRMLEISSNLTTWRSPCLTAWTRACFEQGALSSILYLLGLVPIFFLPGDKMFQSTNIKADVQRPVIFHAYGGAKIHMEAELQFFLRDLFP